YFFFQAEDGIRDLTVTGVQTCALPIWPAMSLKRKFLAQNLLLAVGLVLAAAAGLWRLHALRREVAVSVYAYTQQKTAETTAVNRSEERRVGKEWRSRRAGVRCVKHEKQ